MIPKVLPALGPRRQEKFGTIVMGNIWTIAEFLSTAMIQYFEIVTLHCQVLFLEKIWEPNQRVNLAFPPWKPPLLRPQ